MAISSRERCGEILLGRALVHGVASGALIFSDIALSFWGGVDSQTGEIIDRHHPLSHERIAGKILAIPGGRGSCTGSSVLLELIVNGHAPAGLIVSRQEEILSLGAIVADEVFGCSIPVVQLSESDFVRLRSSKKIGITGNRVALDGTVPDQSDIGTDAPESKKSLFLSIQDMAALNGDRGKACQIAMRITSRMAEIQNASELIDISQVHIDGCIYTGPTSLEFASRMRDWGAKVAVPTTLNAISVDQMRWREQGVAPGVARPAYELGEAYAAMGADKTFTCAPYQLQSAPKFGEQVVWAESNAVVYANSVLGARTAKYPDYLDLCIAITGRAPLAGAHISDNRRARIVVNVVGFSSSDDMIYPLLGYQIGKFVGEEIPVILGLETWKPSPDDLKAFGAGFATTSSSPMFHIVGVTPEASALEDVVGPDVIGCFDICPADLLEVWDSLNAKGSSDIDLVAFGNPHFSFDECERLAVLCRNQKKHPQVKVVVTCGRATFAKASESKLVEYLSNFGVQFVTDACWCMLAEPVIPKSVKTIITTSAKFAHYGPGLTGKALRIGSLKECVQAACEGRLTRSPPAWA